MSEAQQQRYRVIQRLASGGMAEVFLAESAGIEGFKKQVAIKRVLPNLSEKKRFIAMFLDEARLSAHLSHSNVAQVFDIGVGETAYFIVMEYVDGADLKLIIDYLKKEGRTFPVEAAVFIAARICEGLAYAHELTNSDGRPLHIVHRDMSPPNVLITKYGEVKIVDFGLAKATSQLEKSEAGIIKGKFSYLSPEAAVGEEVDQRTDIFAVGIILWEMLGGRRLFMGETDFQTVKLVQQAKIPSLTQFNPEVPPDVDKILAKALARDPDRRYRSARDLGRDLTEFLYRFGRPVSSYDVAEIVLGAMTLRKRVQPDKAEVIDALIEEARLEFKSLQADDRNIPSANRLSEPLKVSGFEDISGWADEISSQTTAQPPKVSAASTSASTSTSTSPAAPKAVTLPVFEDDQQASKGPAASSDSAALVTKAPPPVPPLAKAPPREEPFAKYASGGGSSTKMLLIGAAIVLFLVLAWFALSK